MIYHAICPEPPLDRFVETIFHLKNYQPEHSIERLVPDTRSSLVIELDGQERWVADNETLEPIQTCRGSWVSGPHRRYISISSLPNTECFPEVLKSREKQMYNLITFEPISDTKTKVVSYGIGYKDSPELQKMLKFFVKANEDSYVQFIKYVETGKAKYVTDGK